MHSTCLTDLKLLLDHQITEKVKQIEKGKSKTKTTEEKKGDGGRREIEGRQKQDGEGR
jgi:hypothetical protein